VITVLRNNFDNGWVGFDELTSSHIAASEESGKPVTLTLRRQSSMSLGQLVVSFLAAPCTSFRVSFPCHCIELTDRRMNTVRVFLT